MKYRQVFKKAAITTFIFLASFLCAQNYSFALDTTDSNQQNMPNVLKPAVKEDNQTDNSIQPSYEEKTNTNESTSTNNTNKVNSIINFSAPTKTQTKPQENKTFDLINNQETKPTANIKATPNSRYTITFRGRTIDLKKYLSLTTLIAVVGLTGTFFGLFSTWLIYHLNKKHSNPLILDKHNSAIRYMDDLNRIKIHFANSDIKQVYSDINKGNAQQEDLMKLIMSYENISRNISKVDLLEIHTRYKKHVNKRKYELFNSLIDNYKMIKIDGDHLNLSGKDYHMFDLESLATPSKLNSLKSKTILVMTFEQQIEVILGILRKELKL